ncbi:iron complex outermembrane receptor protein [Nitrosospira sp. Nsp5]|uniref:Iron complex outermembrane recepter protein n=1 Tax=Nitrosospira multiformis TaxID=1231 RepID=A0ABY0T5W5_9PROT|nr:MULTISPECIES: TonB-dependent receptor [Nitrosospira]PTR09498.1 iron complex outermembrane receptor protein [Nitrosospira sp. Nsp5]SDQ28650.1 iron complex outermembrane recepter protein [Nitrosospira multiformis]
MNDSSCNVSAVLSHHLGGVLKEFLNKLLILPAGYVMAVSWDRPSQGRERFVQSYLRFTIILLVPVVFSVASVQAQDIGKDSVLPPVVVTATPFENRSELDTAQPVSVLRGEDLRRKREASLGDTLSRELGVASSSFGPAAGRPIIRGLDGPRIRVLENGIGTLDLSAISPDHAVTAESLNASQIEILRGPATLLYGSGASGGIVNVVSGRIPNQLFKSPKGDIEIRGNTATEERTGAFNATGSIGGRASWSVGGFKRKTGDYHIPGRADESNPSSKKGIVENSAIDSDGISAGGSLVGERGFIGGSISRLESKYGIPSPEGSKIDLKQTRYDLSGELDKPIIGFDKLKIRTGYNDYKHNEIEGTGEIATRFKNHGLESRAELLHAPIKNWQGVFGVQFQDRNFSALGEEAVIPVTKSRSTGIFLVEERNWDRWRLELGGRIERATQDPQNNANPSRAFNLYNVSAGTLWKFMEGYGLGLSATRGQRAPSTEELYIKGAHRGTATFQTGDDTLGGETTSNIDLTLRKNTGPIKWKINVFHNWIDNYIFVRSADTNGDGVADRVDDTGTPDPSGEFLVQNFAQTGARFFGAEAEVIFTLKPDATELRLFTDYVRGKLDMGGNVPRITPQRFGLELNHKVGSWTANVNAFHVMRQNRVAELETSTPGYTLVNVDVSYRIKETKSNGIKIFLQGKNLLNEEMRVHTSFLKNFAPLPGIAAVIGLRGEF